jgi:hypothetical protein
MLAQPLVAQTNAESPDGPPGALALVKEGGKLYGLQLATKTRYRWSGERWVADGSLNVRLPDRRLPFMESSVAHRRKNGTYFVEVSGFGHLWEYRGGNLQRLDTTFFAGSNFGANRFVYKDTLYSHGGYGFWINHGVLAYFDQRFKEWERSALSGYSGAVQAQPIAAFSGKGKRWVWSVSSFPDVSVHEMFVPNGLVYELDLRKKSMEPVGHVRHSVWRLLNKPITAWDSVVLVSGVNGALLVNMAKNQVRQIPVQILTGISLGPLDEWGAGCVALDDTLEIFTIKDRARSRVIVHDRLALRDLWDISEPLGAFIEPIWLSGVKRNYWLPLIAVLIALGAWWVGKQTPRFVPGPQTFVNALDAYERRLLMPLLVAGPEKKWTTYELDAVLLIHDKSWDNQRKIRKTTINDLNTKSLNHLGIAPLVGDERDSEDRREKRYFVSLQPGTLRKELIDLLSSKSPAP